MLVFLVCLITAAAGGLRTFHHGTPRGPQLLGPFGDLLFVGFAGLLSLHLVQRRRGLDLLPRGAAPGLSVAQIAPLLVVVLGEKWISTDLLDPVIDWVDGRFDSPAAADAAYRLSTGLALLGGALLLLPALRQIRPRLARYVNGRRAREAAFIILCAVAGTAAAATFLVVLEDGGWTVAAGPLGIAAAAQVVRGASEELFFRGMLQTSLVWLLVQAGAPDRRAPRLAAIAVVSCAFTLEHIDPQAPRAAALGALAYVFVMSGVLGVLLEASRNLYLPIAAHMVLNLTLLGAIPLPRNGSGAPLMTPTGAGLFFVVLLFTGLAVEHEWARWKGPPRDRNR